MQVIVEISLYPLTENYSSIIANFVGRLSGYDGIEVTLGETSTVIRGDYDVIFKMLEAECRDVLDRDVKSAFVIKLLNTV
ncbi:MAG TPA: YkoF family thiamine/hydroxymethylpyrimidine-binding protein [Saprospiraceae bacterium]|nr:YkoF family thiamine/hydroxymethylpyrimidine-binding protein [Saprospiraceae bacterium]